MCWYVQRWNTLFLWHQSKSKEKCKGIKTFLPCQVHVNRLFTCFESNLFEITYLSYPFVVFMFAKVQQATPLVSTQIHREMQHAQLLDKSPISDPQGFQDAMLSTLFPTHWFFCKTKLLFFYHLLKSMPITLYFGITILNMWRVDVCRGATLLFMKPIQGHRDMQGNPTFLTIPRSFDENLILV